MKTLHAVLGLALAMAPLLSAGASGKPTIVEVREDYLTLADNGRLFYRDSGGGGAAVVFMHAASGNSSVWELQIGPLVQAGYRFIAFDRPGQGRSTRGAAGMPGAPPEIEQLLEHLGVQRFHLVGVAAGGGAALEYVLAHPARVLSLTIANSIGNVQDSAYAELGQRLRPPAFNQLPLELRELGPSYRASNPQGVQRWLELSQGAGGAPGAGTSTTAGPPRAATVPVTWAALEKLSVPTLLLTGDADLYTPPAVLRLFRQHMPQAELAVIAESGHASYWENPAEFNRVLLQFLARH